MSPFETRYVDIRTLGSHSDVPLCISVQEGTHIVDSRPLRFAHLSLFLFFKLSLMFLTPVNLETT